MEVDGEEVFKGRLEARPKAGRMKAIVQFCSAALDQQALEPAVAAAISGRLPFASAAACGRVGAVACHALRQRATERAGNGSK